MVIGMSISVEEKDGRKEAQGQVRGENLTAKSPELKHRKLEGLCAMDLFLGVFGTALEQLTMVLVQLE